MNQLDIARLFSGLSQLGFLYCVFRLTLLSRTTAWPRLLAGGLALVVVLNTSLCLTLPAADYPFANVASAIILALLAVSLACAESALQKYLRVTGDQQKAQSDRETELRGELASLKKSSEEWPKLYDELQQTAAHLQTDLAERKAATNALVSAHEQLTSSNEFLMQTNADLMLANRRLQEIVTRLQAEAADLKRTQEETDGAHQLELAATKQSTAADTRAEICSQLSGLAGLLNGSMQSMNRQMPVRRRERTRILPQLPKQAAPRRKQRGAIRRQLPLLTKGRRMPGELHILSDSVKRIKNGIEQLNLFVSGQAFASEEAASVPTVKAPEPFAVQISPEAPVAAVQTYACQNASTETGTTVEQAIDPAPAMPSVETAGDFANVTAEPVVPNHS